jgi:hypothetical protein
MENPTEYEMNDLLTFLFSVDTRSFKIYTLMMHEISKADKKYANDRMSLEEMKASFLTIKSELTELERETVRVVKRPDLMHKEAIQVMAMAYKFIRDVTLPLQEESL